MSLIHCPDCGQQVSEYATSCPKCSYPISNLKKVQNNTSTNTNSTHQYEDESKGLIIIGYVFAVVSLLFFPVFFSPAGVVVGIITLTKNKTGHGIAHIILSIVCGIIGAFLGEMVYYEMYHNFLDAPR